jgi:Tfp pilus assembly protein PilO
MAVKLNLLPSDYTITGPLATLIKVVRPLNVTLLAIFLAAALGMTGFLIFSSVSLNNLNSTNNSLKSQIQSQQAAQQQVVLLKDRLGKIKRVIAMPSASKSLSNINPLLDSVGETSAITGLDIDLQKTKLSIDFKSNSELTNFVNGLSSQNNFSAILIDSFSYSPVTGYSVGFSFVGK